MTLLLLLFVRCVIKCLVMIRFIRLRYVVLYCYCIEYCYYCCTYLNTASYILLYYHIYHLYTTVMEGCCMTISLMWHCIVAFSYLMKKSDPSHFCCRVVICWMLQRCEVVLPKCWCLNYGAVVHKISVAISNMFSLIT